MKAGSTGRAGYAVSAPSNGLEQLLPSPAWLLKGTMPRSIRPNPGPAFSFSFSQGSQVLTIQTDENSGQKARELQIPSSKNPSKAGWQGSSASPAPQHLTGPLQPAPQTRGEETQSFANSPASLIVYLDSTFSHPLSQLTACKSSVAESISG